MHAIHIRIGCDHNILIPQPIQAFFNIQCVLQQVELLIFIDHFFSKSKTIQRFTPQTKHGLCFYISCFCDGTTGTIAFRYKDGGCLS